MDRSRVYLCYNYLSALRVVQNRRQLLRHITSSQVHALAEIAKRLTDGTITALRRDVLHLRRKRLVLRTLASNRVSLSRKKALSQRHSSLVATMVREVYMIRTIMAELRGAEA